MRFYNDCSKFISDVVENVDTYMEMNKFVASQFFDKMVERVISKAGVLLEVRQVFLMWNYLHLVEMIQQNH